jgi:NADH:ubiquinone oxidoreductase subunit 2 (subunit N)
MLGHAIVLETGLSMMAIGLNQPIGLALFFALLLPRAVSLLVWSGTLSHLEQRAGARLTLAGVRGLAGRYPLVSAGLLLAMFSLAGLPLLSGFPFRWLLSQALAVETPWAAAAVLAGSLGLLMAAIRVIAALVDAPPAETREGLEEEMRRPPAQDLATWLFLVSGGLGSLLVGCFPQWFMPFFARVALMFSVLGR